MQKKQSVAHVVCHGLCSERRACHYPGVHRSTFRYRVKPLTQKQIQLHQRMVALSGQHPRSGHRRIRALFAQEGWSVRREQVSSVSVAKKALWSVPNPNANRAGISTFYPV